MPQTHSTDTFEKPWITEKGRYDLLTAETCECKPHLVGLLVECPTCGTVYGHIRDLGRTQVGVKEPLSFKDGKFRHR